ncbi:hypothetical protein C8R45DRAFT_941853 [Mycena sanguinolenta]|nr:hypothetical protein C8R45DRAFT_941853 [Mycena sanguinolenta]
MGRNKTANMENEEPAAPSPHCHTFGGESKGNQTNNAAWKADTWTACATALAGMESGENGSGGPVKTAKMCSTCWTSEKAEYLVFKTLRGLSGVGWGPKTHTIVVSDEVWETYIKACRVSHFLLLLLMAPSQAHWRRYNQQTGQAIEYITVIAIISLSCNVKEHRCPDPWSGPIHDTHPKAAKYHHESYLLYDEMADLVDGGVTTGDHSCVPCQPTASQADQDDGANFLLDPMLRGKGGVYRPDAQSQSQSVSQLSDSQDDPGTPILDGRSLMMMSPRKYSVKKRARAMSGPLSSASTGKHQHTDGHGHKPGAGHAMLAVSESLKAVATALGRDPGHRSLIRADTSVADVLLAIDENTEMCKDFFIGRNRGTDCTDSSWWSGLYWTSDPNDKIALVAYFKTIKHKIGQGGSWDQMCLESAAVHLVSHGPPAKGAPKNASSVKGVWAGMKKIHDTLVLVVQKWYPGASGWTYDQQAGFSVCDDNHSEWKEFAKQHPVLEPFANKGCFFDDERHSSHMAWPGLKPGLGPSLRRPGLEIHQAQAQAREQGFKPKARA